MQRHTGQRGAALILLIGITAALAILAASLVMLLANQQGATAKERSTKTSMYYAEAALNSAIAAVKGTDTWQTTPFNDSTAMAAMAANYNTLPSPPAVTYAVYDNQATVNRGITWDRGQPTLPTTPDGKVWVEVTTTYQGRTTRVRQMVAYTTESVFKRFPKAALFSGGAGSNDSITMSGSADAYTATFTGWPATNANGVAYTGGAPYPTSIMSKGNISGQSADLALGSGQSKPQSLGVQANGTVSLPGRPSNGATHGGVPDLNTYFTTGAQLKLVTQARECLDPDVQLQFNAAGTVFASEAALRTTTGNLYGTYDSATKTFTADKDLVFNGNLTLNTAGTTYKFKSLYVNGDLTLSGTTTTHTTALHVGGAFSISSTSGTNTFGPVYVVGNVNWGGTASVETTDYLSTADPGPMWVGGVFTRNGGPFNDVYGNVFVVFQVNFTPTSSGHSLVRCPLLATTERITTSGDIDFGTMVVDASHPTPNPMTLYQVCDNDGYYTQTSNWNSTGQFYGLMVLMEAGIDLQYGNATKPAVVGSVLTIGGDDGLTLEGNAQVAYNQNVIDAVCGVIVTTSTTTQTVPGTWQELSVN